MKTYLYVFGAIAAFIAIETALFTAVGGPEKMWAIVGPILATVPLGWLGVLISFIAVSWIANKWALSNTSSAVQHAGLALYIVVLSIFFLPVLCFAQIKGGPGTILSAAMSTAGLFAMLTLVVFFTRKDFSFLRSSLTFGLLAAIGFIATAAVFQFALGPIFMYAMIALFCGYILFYTSNILHHYRIGQHVAAALALFASVMMLFWYILQLFMSRE